MLKYFLTKILKDKICKCFKSVILTMSVTLEVFSDHNMKIKNYYDGIDQIEERLNSKIYHPSEVNNEEIRVFANKAFNAKRYEDYNRIEIYSNSKICNSIYFYKHFVNYSLVADFNLKYHIWLEMISNPNLNDTSQFNEWKKALDYVNAISSSFGATCLFFINDGNKFTPTIDDIMDGEDLDKIFNRLNTDFSQYLDLSTSTHIIPNDNTLIIFKKSQIT